MSRALWFCRASTASLFSPGVVLGNDEIKLVETKSFVGFSLVFNVTSVHKIEQSLIVHHFTNCTGNLLQLLESNKALLFWVVKWENSLQAVLCLVFANSWTNAINEFLEIDRFVSFPDCCNYLLNERASSVEVELFEYFVDLDWVDFAASIFVED